MKAITIIPRKKGSMQLRDVPRYDIGDYEVLVRTRLVGIDGTDKDLLEGVYGDSPEGNYYLIIGHECLGEVVSTGSKVTTMRVGDMVVPSVRRPDDCVNCRAGQQDMCLTGNYTERGISKAHGFMCEYFVEDPLFMVSVPEQLGELGVLLEPTSVAEKAIRMARRVQERIIWRPETALVTGSGTLGLLTAALLKLRAMNVIIVDRSNNKYKDDLYKKLGVTHYNTKEHAIHEIPELIGQQIDIVIEGTGSSAVAMESMHVVGTNGVVVLLSLTPGQDTFDVCASCINNSLVLGNKCVVGSVSANKIDFTQGISDLLAIQRRWPGFLELLITKRFPPEQFQKAIDTLHDSIKTVITFSP